MDKTLRRFNHRDLEEVKEWRETRGLKNVDPEILPHHGLIVPGLAAGFMYIADQKIGILEFFITNPKASKRACWDALDTILKALMHVAIALGCKMIKWDTRIKTFKRRSAHYGFKEVGQYTVFIKEL